MDTSLSSVVYVKAGIIPAFYIKLGEKYGLL